MNRTRRALRAVTLLAAAFGCGCGPGTEASRPGASRSTEPVAISLAPIERAPAPVHVKVVGSLFGDEETSVSAEISGRVILIQAELGDRVAPGAELARLDPTDHELEVAQREAELGEVLSRLGLRELPGAGFDADGLATVGRARLQSENADAKLERGKVLLREQRLVISQEEFSDLETAANVARRSLEAARLEAHALVAAARTRQSQLEAARSRLADTVIRAPAAQPNVAAGGTDAPAPAHSGTTSYAVSRRLISLGQFLQPGAVAYELVVDDPIELRAALPERHAASLEVGQLVSIVVEGQPQEFEGRLVRVSPSIDRDSRTRRIEASIPNRERLLRPGAFARATITVGIEPDATFVPTAAVVSFAGIDRIFVPLDGKAVERVVRVLESAGDRAQVQGELEGCTEVIVRGQAKLVSGAPIRIEESP